MPQAALPATSRLQYFLAGLTANAMWGFIAIPFKALSAWPADIILYFRIFASCLLVWLFLLLFRKDKWKEELTAFRKLDSRSKARLFGLILLSSILIAGNWVTFIYTVNNISIKAGAFAYLICPLITTLAGFLILNEKLTVRKWTSLALALLSVIMLAQSSVVEVLWSAVIASFYAFYLIIQRFLKDMDKFNFLAVQMLVCSLLSLPFYMARNVTIDFSADSLLIVLAISIFFTIIPLFLSMYSLKGITSGTLGILIYINPIISFAVAILYFGEMIDGQQLMAYSLLLIAIALYNSAFVQRIFAKLVSK